MNPTSLAFLLTLLLCSSPVSGQAIVDQRGGSDRTAKIRSHCGQDLEMAGSVLAGTVRDLLTTDALSGVAVAVRPEGANVGDQIAVTDEEGLFVFCNLGWTGPTRVEALAPKGGASGKTRVDLATGSTWLATQYLETVRPATLGGRVLNASGGGPLQGALVRIEPIGLSTSTDAEGLFSVQGLAGEVTIVVTHASLPARLYRTWLEGGFAYNIEVALGPEGTALPPVAMTGGSGATGGQELAVRSLDEGSAAGGTPAAGLDPARRGVLALDVGSRVRLTAPGVSVTSGIVRGVESESLLVAENDQQWTVPTQELQSLHVSRTSSVRLGVIVGLLGFGAGALLGGKVITEIDPDTCVTTTSMAGGVLVTRTTCENKPVGAMRFAGRFGLVGAGAGFALGRVVFRWQPLF